MALIIIVSAGIYFFNINGKSLDFSDSELMIVPTGSMDAGPKDFEIPTIPKDSLIMTHHLSAEQKADLKVGDVITFHQGGLVKVHRIITILDSGTVITQGDANPNPDDPVSSEDIIGKVVGVSAGVGKVISVIKGAMVNNPFLFFVAVVQFIVMIYAIAELISLLREKPDFKE